MRYPVCMYCGRKMLPLAMTCPFCKKKQITFKPSETKDHTEEFDAEDVARGRVLCVLSYLFVLALIPLLSSRSTDYVRFHAKQGLILSVITTVYIVFINAAIGFCRAMTGSVFTVIAGVILYAALLYLFYLAALGIGYAVKRRAKELPGFYLFFRKREE